MSVATWEATMVLVAAVKKRANLLISETRNWHFFYEIRWVEIQRYGNDWFVIIYYLILYDNDCIYLDGARCYCVIYGGESQRNSFHPKGMRTYFAYMLYSASFVSTTLVPSPFVCTPVRFVVCTESKVDSEYRHHQRGNRFICRIAERTTTIAPTARRMSVCRWVALYFSFYWYKIFCCCYWYY